MATSSIRLTDLHDAVGAAVKAAVAKHHLHLEKQMAIGPGVLIGPLLRPSAHLTVETAEHIAQEIATATHTALAAHAHGATHAGGADAKLHLPQLQPGIAFSHGLLLCGFWPPFPILDVSSEVTGGG